MVARRMTETPADMCIIFNPTAGRGQAQRRLARWRSTWGRRCELQPTREPGHAVELARQSGQGKAALFEAAAALWEAFFGNAPEARQSAMAVLELSKDRDVEYGAA